MKLGRLEKVELRDQWKDEARDFTPWLAEDENLELLGETLGIELERVGVEEKVGSFSADILCKDIATDKHVVIENQLEQTDHSHLGQVITYYAGLQASNFVWISSQVREEHRAAVDWLNTITDDNYNFFAVEVQLFKIGDSAIAPNFKIVAKPNGWSKSVRRQTSEELSETDALRIEYWDSFKNYVSSQQKVVFKLQKSLPQNWYNITIGTSAMHLNCIIGRKKTNIAIQLLIDSDKAKQHYGYLYEHYYERSQAELGADIEWDRMDDKKSCTVTASMVGDYHDKSDWNRQFEWLFQMTTKFYEFFKPAVKNIK
ncbi:MAG: DUF4268 domain-containing protein [Candidatus Cryptobacteroides sp.]